MEKNSHKIPELPIEEYLMQISLGTLSKDYKISICQDEPIYVAKGARSCWLCKSKIKAGDHFYEV